MGNQRMDGEEQEALFHSYPCADYYVQSPSTLSHANSTDCRNHDSSFLCPFPLESFNATATNASQEVSRFTLSRYSSSRGSNNAFLHQKKISYDLQSHENVTDSLKNHPVIGIEEGLKEDGEDEEGKRKYGLLSFGYSSSWFCVAFQIVWRILVSLGMSLLVFFLVTRPPPPRILVKMGGIREFGLGEGIDYSGVVTKILNCNCSLLLEIENRSKLFGLHIRRPSIEMTFGRLNLANSQGQRLYVESNSMVTFPLSVGTKSKATYGAGRSMQDLLESGDGLPLLIHVKLSSTIRVVWNLIRPTYRHQAHCLLIVDDAYDELHHTQAFNSTCTTTAFT